MNLRNTLTVSLDTANTAWPDGYAAGDNATSVTDQHQRTVDNSSSEQATSLSPFQTVPTMKMTDPDEATGAVVVDEELTADVSGDQRRGPRR